MHLNAIVSFGSFSFGDNHFHIEQEEFNDHRDPVETSQEISNHHKHKHHKNEKEHEHGHLLSLDHKDIIHSYSNINFQNLYFKKKLLSKNLKNLKRSHQPKEVFRPPIYKV